MASRSKHGLTPASLRWYQTTVKEYGLATAAELETLRQAGLALDAIEACRAAIRRDGMTVNGARGLTVHPAAREERQHRQIYLVAVRSLGLMQPNLTED